MYMHNKCMVLHGNLIVVSILQKIIKALKFIIISFKTPTAITRRSAIFYNKPKKLHPTF